MTRRRVDCFTVARIIDCLSVARIVDCLTVARTIDRSAVTSSTNCSAVTGHVDCLSIAKGILALLVSFSLGTVVYADRALVGTAPASVGATIFAGDRLSTDPSGSVQVRAGAARLLLSSASTVTFSQDDASPAV